MNWLKIYSEYTRDHEAPPIFHKWVGISTVVSALERKVWVKMMYEKIYANLYVILVAPPGRCRKSSSIKLGSSILKTLDGINTTAEKTTPESLIQELEGSESCFYIGNRVFTHSSLSVLASELGVFTSVRPEDMIKLLTELFDSQIHDVWTYRTKGSGVNQITGVWLNILGGTVPAFFLERPIQASIGLGFTSRCIFVFAEKRRKRSLTCDDSLRGELERGLQTIHELKGEFTYTEDAKAFFGDWYLNLPQEHATIAALAPYYERKHVHLLKTAMALSAAEGGNKMQLTRRNVEGALKLLEKTERAMPQVFGALHRSLVADDFEVIQLFLERVDGAVAESAILQEHYLKIHPETIKMILQTLVQMRIVTLEVQAEGQRIYTYVGEEKAQ